MLVAAQQDLGAAAAQISFQLLIHFLLVFFLSATPGELSRNRHKSSMSDSTAMTFGKLLGFLPLGLMGRKFFKSFPLEILET